MDFVIELVLDLLLEGSIEISSNKKVSKYIRYPLIALISLIFIALLLLIFFVGVSILREFPIIGLLFFVFDMILIIICIKKFKSLYCKKRDND